jgi:Rod binding domain-containing protein
MPEIPLHFTPAAATSHTEVNSAARKKLHAAANEFESMLLTSLWKSFKESSLDDSDSDDATGQTYQDFALQAMSSAVAAGGGFGIGRIIEQDLAPKINGDSGSTTPLPAFSPLD